MDLLTARPMHHKGGSEGETVASTVGIVKRPGEHFVQLLRGMLYATACLTACLPMQGHSSSSKWSPRLPKGTMV
ncbi:hypothetical protein BDW66DRAFT_140174 [Aspergillus desertorum]